MAWIALDIGTSQWKAAVFAKDGHMLSIVRSPIPLTADAKGYRVVRPDTVLPAVLELLKALPLAHKRAARGIAVSGMAEGGLLLNKKSLQPETDLLPWFDNRAAETAAQLEQWGLFSKQFTVTGLPFSPKYSLFKILALLEETGLRANDVLWAGVPEYIAYLLTGSLASEPTLAARTYAFDIRKGQMDAQLLEDLGLSPQIFPPLVSSRGEDGHFEPFGCPGNKPAIWLICCNLWARSSMRSGWVWHL